MSDDIHVPLIEEGGWLDIQIVVLSKYGTAYDMARYESLTKQGYKVFFWLPEFNQYNPGEFLGIRYWMGLPLNRGLGESVNGSA